MEIERLVKLIAAYCAVHDDRSLFSQVLKCCDSQTRLVLKLELQRLHASKLLRLLAKNRHFSADDLQQTIPAIVQNGNQFFLQGTLIGESRFLYKTTMPYEAQSRIAYEVFYETFLDLLAQKWQILALTQSDIMVEVFIPVGAKFDFDQIWTEICGDIFGLDNIRKTFVALVNSIKLTNRGFSALDLPVVNQAQAKVIASFNLHNLQSLQKGDQRRHLDIEQLEGDKQRSNSQREKEQLQNSLDKAHAELEKRTERYGPLYARCDEIMRQNHLWSRQVATLTAEFTALAATQISKSGNKIGKAVEQINKMLTITESDQWFSLPKLLSPIKPISSIRPGGDTNTRFCYSCGNAIPKGEPSYQANSFIFSSPSQRLQSGGSQTQPNICGSCAAISFVSPIKLGEGRLIVRLYLRKQQTNLMLDEQIRMLALGEMNVVAGKYALLQAPERIGNDPIIDKLGTLQYALYKVGTLFPPEVFTDYAAEVTIGETRLCLQSRHLTWMALLADVFELRRSKWEDKGEFAAFGRSIRHIEKDETISAIYELLKQNLIAVPLNRVRSMQLEKLRSEQIRWLIMDQEYSKAEFYRDVAGMTGLLYAFCSFVKGQFTGNEQRIEVRKLIERTNDPNQFIYTAAGNTKSEMATLYRSEDMHFSFDEVKRLLEWIGVDITERESRNERGQPIMKLYLDDVVKAYAMFFESRYARTKDQRDFIYALQLSLHSRFPELIERKKEKE